MVVGEPSLMGGEFGDEDERLITRLENSQYDTTVVDGVDSQQQQPSSGVSSAPQPGGPTSQPAPNAPPSQSAPSGGPNSGPPPQQGIPPHSQPHQGGPQTFNSSPHHMGGGGPGWPDPTRNQLPDVNLPDKKSPGMN